MDCLSWSFVLFPILMIRKFLLTFVYLPSFNVWSNTILLDSSCLIFLHVNDLPNLSIYFISKVVCKCLCEKAELKNFTGFPKVSEMLFFFILMCTSTYKLPCACTPEMICIWWRPQNLIKNRLFRLVSMIMKKICLTWGAKA